jgi:hypothetical protein
MASEARFDLDSGLEPLAPIVTAGVVGRVMRRGLPRANSSDGLDFGMLTCSSGPV